MGRVPHRRTGHGGERCPLVQAEGLFAFIVPSPKQQDLHRDGRYALHSIPLATNEDAFYVAGEARYVSDESVRGRLSDQFVDERSAIGVPPPADDHHLFELHLATALLTRTTGHGDAHPQHLVWHAP